MKKIGVVGFANIYKKKWGKVIEEHPNYRLAGIARRNMDNKSSLVERVGYKSFTKEEVDLVYVPLPNSYHYEICKYYLELGVSVIVEKPSSVLLQEVIELVEIANKNNCFLIEAFQWRHHLRTKELIKMINVNFKPYFIDVVFTIPHLEDNNIRYSKELSGGAALDLGAYPASVISTLFPNEEFYLSNDFHSWKDGFDVDIGGNGTFFSENHEIVLKFFYAFGKPYESKLIFHTYSGRVEVNQPFTIGSFQEAEIIIEEGLEKSTKRFVDCHFNSLLNFLDSEFDYKEINNQTLIQAKLLNQIIEKL